MAIKETPLPSISNPWTDETTYDEEIEKSIRSEFVRCVDPRTLFCYVPDLLSNAEEERVEACQKENGRAYAARLLLQLVSRRKNWVSLLKDGLRHDEVRLHHLADNIQQLQEKYLKELRLVLIGSTKAGKSSCGNTILGKDGTFDVHHGAFISGKYNKWDYNLFDDTLLEVTDTPGVFCIDYPDEEVLNLRNKASLLMAPGPHVFLLVMRGDHRFSIEHEDAYKEIKSYFGPEMIKHMIVIFTGMDHYTEGIEEFRKALTYPGTRLQNILKEADNRWIGFNNKASTTNRRTQAENLIKMVKDLVRSNNYSYYSTPQMKKHDELLTSMERDERLTRREIKTKIVKNYIDISDYKSVRNEIKFVHKNECRNM